MINNMKIQKFRNTLVVFGLCVTASVQAQTLELLPDEPASDVLELLTPPILRQNTQDSFSILDNQDEETDSASAPSSDQSELIQQRFSNGGLHVERHAVEDEQGNFVNHGDYVEYNAKGEVVRHGKYSYGSLDGEWKQMVGVEAIRQLTDSLDAGFQPPFQSHVTFRRGKLTDVWTVTDSKGKLVFIWQFEDGQRNNLSVWYNSRSDVIREMTYDSNVPNGPALISDPKTKKPTQIQLAHGRIVQTKTEWYDPHSRQKKKSEENVLVPYASSIVDHDWWNCRISAQSEKSAEPVRHGLVSNWYANSQLAYQGNYEQGKQNGEFSWYYENGQTKGRGWHKDDVKVGEWTWWHATGMKQASGIYEAGLATGVWSSWNADGRLVQRGDAEMVFASIEKDDQPAHAIPIEVPVRSASRMKTLSPNHQPRYR